MQSNSPVPNFNYSLSGGGNSTTPMLTVLKTIDPTIYDIQYSVKQRWLNTVESREWILTGFICNSGVTTANWLQISDGDALVDFAVPNGTTPISPDTNGLVNFTQSGQITITGSAGGSAPASRAFPPWVPRCPRPRSLRNRVWAGRCGKPLPPTRTLQSEL